MTRAEAASQWGMRWWEWTGLVILGFALHVAGAIWKNVKGGWEWFAGRVILAMLLIPLLVACQRGTFSSVQRFRYGDLRMKVIVAPGPAIDAHCRKRGTKLNDRGILIGPRARIACCTDKVRRTIWISEDMPECIFHEACHLSGKTNAECADVRLEPE